MVGQQTLKGAFALQVLSHRASLLQFHIVSPLNLHIAPCFPQCQAAKVSKTRVLPIQDHIKVWRALGQGRYVVTFSVSILNTTIPVELVLSGRGLGSAKPSY